MSTMTEPHTNGHDRELGGVRTYRGRKLEDLIPQIRAELGPDAIILRQREGLMGGVGGFFAQKCVEVDAQAAPRVDVYDDDKPVSGWDDFDDSSDIYDETPTPIAADPSPLAPAPDRRPALPAAEEPYASEAYVPPAPEAYASPNTSAPEPAALESAALEPTAGPPAPTAFEPAAHEGAAESFVNRLEQAAAHVDIDELVRLVTTGGLPTPGDQSIAPPAPEAAEPLTPEPVTDEAAVPEPVIPEPIAPPTPAAAPVSPTPAPVASAPVPPAANPWVAKQAGDLDSDDATAVANELTAQGISDAWAHELIVAAAAHRSPLAKGSLRDAVRATLAASIPAPAPLPPAGAAIAFVGAGGAGKTRCAAALASAYAKGSTLAASVVSLGSDDWGGDLKELLKGQNVWVMGAAQGAEAFPAVQHGRDGGLVVVDTAGVTPRDPAGVESLANELRSLSLDAVYIAVPATFSVHAARKLVEGFAALGADGIAVTHGDEADQLGIAAELAHISGMPVAYIHEGLELDGALSAADPSSLAARLLP